MATNVGILGIRADWRTKRFSEHVAHLKTPRLNRALSTGVNDAARQVERQAERMAAQSLGLKIKRARVGIFVYPASTPKTLKAVVRSSTSEIPLKAFRAREQGEGVTARLWGSQQYHPGAFMFGGPNHAHNRDLGMGGHVFHRVGKKRSPIAKAKGATLSQATSQAAVRRAILVAGEERLRANVLRQLERYTRKARGKF